MIRPIVAISLILTVCCSRAQNTSEFKDGKLLLRFAPDSATTELVLIVYGPDGETVFMDKRSPFANSYAADVDLNPFAPGVYTLRVSRDAVISEKKFERSR